MSFYYMRRMTYDMDTGWHIYILYLVISCQNTISPREDGASYHMQLVYILHTYLIGRSELLLSSLNASDLCALIGCSRSILACDWSKLSAVARQQAAHSQSAHNSCQRHPPAAASRADKKTSGSRNKLVFNFTIDIASESGTKWDQVLSELGGWSEDP